MYSLPMSFSTRMLTRSNNDIEMLTTFDERPDRWEWMDLPDHFMREVGWEEHQVDYLLSDSPAMLLSALLNENPAYYEYKDLRYNLDTPVLREILRTVRYYYERGSIPDYDSAIMTDGGKISEEDALFTYYWTFLHGTIEDYTRFELSSTIQAAGGSVVFYPSPMIRGAEGMSIHLGDEFAISANAPNKAAAWEFMKILFSDEVQNGVGILYQPVIADLNGEAVERATGKPGITPEEVIAYNIGRTAFFSGINHVAQNPYPAISGFVVENSSAYIKGEKDLDSIIEYLQSRSGTVSPP
jgi:ABC-type glycerol-3-phosphate transport system substrate-binding protein